MKKAICSKGCGYETEFEPDYEYGLTYEQAEGSCPNCNAPLVYENGKPTRQSFVYKIHQNNNKA